MSFFPGYAKTFGKVGKERGWGGVTRAAFDAVTGPTGALLVGSADEVAEKILRFSEALGGVERFYVPDGCGVAAACEVDAVD